MVAGTVMVGCKEKCRDCPASLVHRTAEGESGSDSSKAADQKAAHNSLVVLDLMDVPKTIVVGSGACRCKTMSGS